MTPAERALLLAVAEGVRVLLRDRPEHLEYRGDGWLRERDLGDAIDRCVAEDDRAPQSGPV